MSSDDRAGAQDFDEPADGEPAYMAEARKAAPIMPTAAEAAAAQGTTPVAPTTVQYAFWLWVAAGLIGVLNVVLFLINKQQVIDQWAKDPDFAKQTREQLENNFNTTLWFLLVGAIAMAAFFALFALKARDGARKARTILTVLAVISLVFNVLLFPYFLGLLSALVAMIALLMLYLPASAKFYDAVDAAAR